jgi:hypothetical protein
MNDMKDSISINIKPKRWFNELRMGTW